MKFPKEEGSHHLIYNIFDDKNGNVHIGYIRRTQKGVWQLYLNDDCSLDIEEMEEILKKMKDLQ